MTAADVVLTGRAANPLWREPRVLRTKRQSDDASEVVNCATSPASSCCISVPPRAAVYGIAADRPNP
jgi:hypothetical protein